MTAQSVTSYLNTDLDLVSKENLYPLANLFESRGLWVLSIVQGDDKLWYLTAETDAQHLEPEASITEMAAVIKDGCKSTGLQQCWDSCSKREFNIGYDAGSDPWAYSQKLSASVIADLALLKASLAVTIYPHRSKDSDQS